MADLEISRLEPGQAAAIVDCFKRVYGDSYANEVFYDAGALADALRTGRIGSVGAVSADGTVFAHMAMTVHAEATVIELGNTVVDPALRGGGLAWEVGAELSRWAQELDYPGFLHYPTTSHHIMQRRSVTRGFETGLMLGYIPADTNGQVREQARRGRQAATIVYEPYRVGPAAAAHLPERYAELLTRLAAPTGLVRDWQQSRGHGRADSIMAISRFARRGLLRIHVDRVGDDIERTLAALLDDPSPCRQVDFRLSDVAVAAGVEAAVALGYRFCGWLPGYRHGDVLRLQRVDEAVTEVNPELVNPVAQSLLIAYRDGS
jgi:hypothetical protein